MIDFILSKIQKWLIEYPDIITTPSEYGKRVLMEKYGVPENKIIVLRNGITIPCTRCGKEVKTRNEKNNGGECFNTTEKNNKGV